MVVHKLRHDDSLNLSDNSIMVSDIKYIKYIAKLEGGG